MPGPPRPHFYIYKTCVVLGDMSRCWPAGVMDLVFAAEDNKATSQSP